MLTEMGFVLLVVAAPWRVHPSASMECVHLFDLSAGMSSIEMTEWLPPTDLAGEAQPSKGGSGNI